MWRIFRVAVLIACLGWTGTARAYDLVRVVSGNTLLVTQDGRQVRLHLDGLWVPAPPGPGVQSEYMGAEAREFVEQALFSLPAFVKEVEPVDPGAKSIAVRIRLGEHADFDLAELVAEAGLGLADHARVQDPAHLEVVYQAERQARRAMRGMHSGGYAEFSRRSGRVVVNFGIGTLATPDPRRRRGSLQAYVQQLGSSGSAPQATGLHRTPVDAIRDWGSQMGLPRDHSAWGR